MQGVWSGVEQSCQQEVGVASLLILGESHDDEGAAVQQAEEQILHAGVLLAEGENTTAWGGREKQLSSDYRIYIHDSNNSQKHGSA